MAEIANNDIAWHGASLLISRDQMYPLKLVSKSIILFTVGSELNYSRRTIETIFFPRINFEGPVVVSPRRGERVEIVNFHGDFAEVGDSCQGRYYP